MLPIVFIDISGYIIKSKPIIIDIIETKIIELVNLLIIYLLYLQITKYINIKNIVSYLSCINSVIIW